MSCSRASHESASASEAEVVGGRWAARAEAWRCRAEAEAPPCDGDLLAQPAPTTKVDAASTTAARRLLIGVIVATFARALPLTLDPHVLRRRLLLLLLLLRRRLLLRDRPHFHLLPHLGARVAQRLVVGEPLPLP